MSDQNITAEHHSQAQEAADTSVPEITSAQAKQAQDRLIAQEQRALEEPETAKMQEAQAGMEQQYATKPPEPKASEAPQLSPEEQAAIMQEVETRRQAIMKDVQLREQLAQNLDRPEGPGKAALIGGTLTAGTLIAADKLGNAEHMLEGAAKAAAKKGANIDKILDKLPIKEVQQAVQENAEAAGEVVAEAVSNSPSPKELLEGIVSNINIFKDRKSIAAELKTQLTATLGQVEGLESEAATALAEKISGDNKLMNKLVGFVKKGDEKKIAEKIGELLETHTQGIAEDTKGAVVDGIKNQATTMAKTGQEIFSSASAKELESVIEGGIKENGFIGKTANGVVHAIEDTLPGVDTRLKVTAIIIGGAVMLGLGKMALDKGKEKEYEKNVEELNAVSTRIEAGQRGLVQFVEKYAQPQMAGGKQHG
jgi:hypothetical protein